MSTCGVVLQLEPTATDACNAVAAFINTRSVVPTSSAPKPTTGWRKFDPADYQALPDAPVVYVFLVDERVVYVGETKSLRSRMRGYSIKQAAGWGFFTPWGRATNLTAKFAPSRKYGDWAMRELRLIRRLQPVWNIRGCNKREWVSGHRPRPYSEKTRPAVLPN